MIDFERSWEIAREAELEEHNSECSFRTTEGGVLCDCDILYKHPEVLKEMKDESHV